MAKTQAELVAAVLHDLSQLSSAYATPTAEDTAVVVARLPGVVSELARRRIAGAINTAAIDDALFPDLVRVVAEHVAPMFGRPTNIEALVAAEGRLAQLYRLERTGSTPFVLGILEQLEVMGGSKLALDATAVSDRLPGILGELIGQRIIPGTVTAAAVPTSMAPDLTRYIAASLMAPPLGDVMQEARAGLARLYRFDRTTSTPLVRQVLEQLEIYGASQSVLDAQAISDRIPGILADLSRRDVIYIPDENSITDEMRSHLCRYIAASIGPATLYPVMTAAEDALRELRGRRRPRALRVDRALMGRR